MNSRPPLPPARASRVLLQGLAAVFLCSLLPAAAGAQGLEPATVSHLLPRANAGSVHDQLELARAYLSTDQPADAQQAFHWYSVAANSGDPVAQTAIGMMYQIGLGTPRDVTSAALWYRRAAAEAYAPALDRLGELYYHGRGVPRDDAEAFLLINRAAQQKYAPAEGDLGVLYLLGRGVAQDEATAVRWLKKAAKHDAPSAFSLAWCYEGGRGVAQDFRAAAQWYQSAADVGFASAENNLGLLYENGNGVAADAAKALALYHRAAQSGLPNAVLNLTRVYLNGPATLRDRHAGLFWATVAGHAGLIAPHSQAGIDSLLQALSSDERRRIDSEVASWLAQHPIADDSGSLLASAQSSATGGPEQR